MEDIRDAEQIKWNSFDSDEQIKDKLKQLVHEINISKFALKTKLEVEKVVKDYLVAKGFHSIVMFSVSEPNETGQRMAMGTATSPLSGEIINF